jgi:hypothetical protein
MRLREWVENRGRGELVRLMHATRVAYTTLHKLANDQNTARYPTAKKISAATGGAVSIAELCELPPPPPAPLAADAKKRRSRSSKTTSCAQPKLADART